MIAIYQGVLVIFVIFVIFVVAKAMLKTFLKDYLAAGILRLCCGCLKGDEKNSQPGNNKNEGNNRNDENSKACDKRTDGSAEKPPEYEQK